MNNTHYNIIWTNPFKKDYKLTIFPFLFIIVLLQYLVFQNISLIFPKYGGRIRTAALF